MLYTIFHIDTWFSCKKCYAIHNHNPKQVIQLPFVENYQWNRKKLSLNGYWVTRLYYYVVGTFMCQVFYTRSSAPQNDIIRGMTVSEDDWLILRHLGSPRWQVRACLACPWPSLKRGRTQAEQGPHATCLKLQVCSERALDILPRSELAICCYNH